MRPVLRRALLLASSLLLAACGSEKPKATPLENFEPKLQGQVLWQARFDRVTFALAVQARDGMFVVAGGDGSVAALDAASGAERWRANAGAALTAGVGSDGRFAAVVTRNDEVVVFERGTERWRKRLNSRVTTAPFVAGERVFVMGVDRIVVAFDALDGRPLWRLQRPTDALTLSQPGVLAAYKDTLLVGQGFRLVGVDPLRGGVRWEVALANPRGTNEIERLADLVGPPLRVGDVWCARAFQSAVACARADNATLRWSRNVGGIQPVGGDSDIVVGADASDRITAWKTASGDIAWTQEKLLYRGLSGALVTEAAVLVGDSEGYVHALARDDGHLLARWSTDGSPVVAPPVRLGDTVLVVTRNGGLYAMRVG
ncbi:MAG TPA: outer membrane protein assembly factor BamB [Burkholderiaceae bacterium]|nr:outer membrane protein assembly factor BamB [Burkholderiaceae bacterium]